MVGRLLRCATFPPPNMKSFTRSLHVVALNPIIPSDIQPLSWGSNEWFNAVQVVQARTGNYYDSLPSNFATDEIQQAGLCQPLKKTAVALRGECLLSSIFQTQSLGGLQLVETSGLVSLTNKTDVARMFAKNYSGSEELKSIVWKIKLCKESYMADISNISYIPNEGEYLLPARTIMFIKDDVVLIPSKSMSQIIRTGLAEHQEEVKEGLKDSKKKEDIVRNLLEDAFAKTAILDELAKSQKLVGKYPLESLDNAKTRESLLVDLLENPSIIPNDKLIELVQLPTEQIQALHAQTSMEYIKGSKREDYDFFTMSIPMELGNSSEA